MLGALGAGGPMDEEEWEEIEGEEEVVVVDEFEALALWLAEHEIKTLRITIKTYFKIKF